MAFVTAEVRAAATRMYMSATRLIGIVMQKGPGEGLDSHTLISMENDYNNYIDDLNLISGMEFGQSAVAAADKGVRIGPMISAIEAISRAARLKTKKPLTKFEICTPTLTKSNQISGKNFTIYAIVTAETDVY